MRLPYRSASACFSLTLPSISGSFPFPVLSSVLVQQRSGCLGLGVAVGLPGTCAVIYSAELCSGAFERRSERLTWCAACSPITLWACRRTFLRPARGSLWAVRRVFFLCGKSRLCWRPAAPCRRVCAVSRKLLEQRRNPAGERFLCFVDRSPGERSSWCGPNSPRVEAGGYR
ncbi:hypothetical protein NDU88_001082 [Pleurodeles waltl]|uniref:Secreted protein n=1 Tax=Pleurodeles waltl TaxID=8319 RepID=A0AAV7VVF3_PLEWA|nr:hypothetical protein NDU88_001082 [Pleurodeles waltl]